MGRRHKRSQASATPKDAAPQPAGLAASAPQPVGPPALRPLVFVPPGRREKWLLAGAVLLQAAWIAVLGAMALAS